MRNLSAREKLILVGLYLSKFDVNGLTALGFNGFAEAFNTIALSLKASPASLKNYRDEFDPYYPNPRKGWHKRPIRQYCKDLMNEFGEMGLVEFASIIKSKISVRGDIDLIEEQMDSLESSSFAKRMVTGQAAEKYFETICHSVPPFENCKRVNTTFLGCGFDYKMVPSAGDYYVVEVKGMSAPTGPIQMTNKEYKAAEYFSDRFFLFVVRNFADKPVYSVFNNPLASPLKFERRESCSVQVSWSTLIGV